MTSIHRGAVTEKEANNTDYNHATNFSIFKFSYVQKV